MADIAPHDVLESIHASLTSPVAVGEVDEIIGGLHRKIDRLSDAYDAVREHAERMAGQLEQAKAKLFESESIANSLGDRLQAALQKIEDAKPHTSIPHRLPPRDDSK